MRPTQGVGNREEGVEGETHHESGRVYGEEHGDGQYRGLPEDEECDVVGHEGDGHAGDPPHQVGEDDGGQPAVVVAGEEGSHPGDQFSLLKAQRMYLQGKGGGTGPSPWNMRHLGICGAAPPKPDI